MRRILIINGPNLNLTGRREPEIYGTRTMDDIIAETRRAFDGRAEIEYFQSNCEGAIIDRLHAAGFGAVDGIVLNAGAYTHTSLAIADAIAASQVAAREPIRRQSLIGAACRGTITGFGPAVYRLACDALLTSA